MAEKKKKEQTYGSCARPMEHRDHMCNLMERGQTADIEERSSNPTHVCINCGARANDREDLCNPEPLK